MALAHAWKRMSKAFCKISLIVFLSQSSSFIHFSIYCTALKTQRGFWDGAYRPNSLTCVVRYYRPSQFWTFLSTSARIVRSTSGWILLYCWCKYHPPIMWLWPSNFCSGWPFVENSRFPALKAIFERTKDGIKNLTWTAVGKMGNLFQITLQFRLHELPKGEKWRFFILSFLTGFFLEIAITQETAIIFQS